MARHLILARREYAEPLEQIGEVESDGTPTVASAGVGDDWLELVAIPADAIVWIQRDGELVRQQAEVIA